MSRFNYYIKEKEKNLEDLKSRTYNNVRLARKLNENLNNLKKHSDDELRIYNSNARNGFFYKATEYPELTSDPVWHKLWQASKIYRHNIDINGQIFGYIEEIVNRKMDEDTYNLFYELSSPQDVVDYISGKLRESFAKVGL